MTTTMTIGDFSRATRLSAKTLRFYHQAGLLEPAQVDPFNGYRMYSAEQINDAQVIRHFRSLDMPIDGIREVLATTDVGTRNAVIAEHLGRMEAQLELTRSAVASLRGLLSPAGAAFVVEHRSVPATTAYVIRDTIDLTDLGEWYTGAVAALDELRPDSTDRRLGGIWDNELFLDERGPAALFIPVASLVGLPASVGRARIETLPAVDLAVATHRGTDDTIGQVYAALAEYVAQHELGIDGPLRESYLPGSRDDDIAVTEIGWPIFRTTR